MPNESELWREKERLLARAGREFRKNDPAGVHDLRVALRRITATAEALGRDKLARRSRKLVRSLSDRRQLETDRGLLSRVSELGLLDSDAASRIEHLWTDAAKDPAAGPKPGRIRKLRRDVARLPEEPEGRLRKALRKARRTAETEISSPPAHADDRDLHRYRLKVKRARYVGEDLLSVGDRRLLSELTREKKLQETLGHWNDLRLFRERLDRTRRQAETRGAVRLASEISRLLSALRPTVEAARRQALATARQKPSRRPAR